MDKKSREREREIERESGEREREMERVRERERKRGREGYIKSRERYISRMKNTKTIGVRIQKKGL